MEHRTTQQNRALHKFFTLLSDELNTKGLEMPMVLTTSIWWTPSAVKERLWRPLQKAMYNKTSTTELEKGDEINKIHEQLMFILGEKHGVDYIDFPNSDGIQD